jgi:hypothetical protein
MTTSGEDSIEKQIKSQKCKWIGQTLRKKETPLKDRHWSETARGVQEGKAQRNLVERCTQ